jgi:hypothetical protein
VTRRSDLRPDEISHYGRLEARWRSQGELGEYASISRCEAKWERFVERVKNGYDNSQYEWRNDLASRSIVQRAIDELPYDLSRRLSARVRASDSEFKAFTTPVKQQYRTGDWWLDRLPLSLGPQLEKELGYLLES